MALFGGGGGGSTTKTTRPDYINNFIKTLNNQVNSTNVGDYTALQQAGLTDDQIKAYQDLMNSDYLNNAASQLYSSGQEGINTLNTAYQNWADLYNQPDTTNVDIENLANQLYSQSDVQDLINAQNQQIESDLGTSTLPQIAEQSNQAGFGSSGALLRSRAKQSAAQQEQNAAAQASQNAYDNALQQAQSIVSGNQSNRRAALTGLTGNAMTQSGMLQQGSLYSQQALNNGVYAAQQQQAQNQSALDTNYKNQMAKQNWGYQQINNQLGAANVLNAAQGQQTKTTTSGGGSGILGGAMSGMAAGAMTGNPYIALAGAAVGALSSA